MLRNINCGRAASAYVIVILFGSISCLKIVGVAVPTLADLRQPASLVCSYDTGQDDLYSVKWYKDDHEFYRYTPGHTPSVITFPLTGASVEKSEDGSCSKSQCGIKLGQLTPLASGAYTCEVSTEAPTFRTAFETKNMTVAALPLEKPRIEGLRSSYAIGELLEITCRTAPSAPPSIPKFFINDAEIEERYISRSVVTDDADMLISSARLKLGLSKGHFLGGALLRVRCSASVVTIPAISHSSYATAALADTQNLHNQKLEWSNTSSQLSSSTMLFSITALFSTAQLFIRFFIDTCR
ncbi:uncharacterized protein LOC143914591 [Arctopsyche grandis]|uniref:uncharacterized protein LOC143914591 n=1 Tax=Arctopsyche grandis TaxID=121162 RepID=UPI00406D939B